MSQPPPAPDFSGGDHLQAWQLPQRAPAPLANTIAGLSPMTGLAQGLLNPQRTANQIASLPTMMQEDQRRYVDQLRDPSHQTDYTVGRMPDRVNQALAQLPSLIAPELAGRGSSMLERDASALSPSLYTPTITDGHIQDTARFMMGNMPPLTPEEEAWHARLDSASPDEQQQMWTELRRAGDPDYAPSGAPSYQEPSEDLSQWMMGTGHITRGPSRAEILPQLIERQRGVDQNGTPPVSMEGLINAGPGAIGKRLGFFGMGGSGQDVPLLGSPHASADPMFTPGGLPQRAPLGPPQGMRGSQMPEIGQGGLWRDAPFGQQQFPERSWGLDAPPSATSATPQPAGPLSIQRGPNQNGSDYFVARNQGGNFVGHTSVARDGSNLYPDDMMVLPQFRRQGVMTQIMTEAERQLGQDLQRPRIATPDGRGFRRSYFDTLQGQRNSAADLPQLPHAPAAGGEPSTPSPDPQHNPFWRWSDLTGGGGEDAPVSLDPPRSQAAWTAPLGQDARGHALPSRAVDAPPRSGTPPPAHIRFAGLGNELSHMPFYAKAPSLLTQRAARFGTEAANDPRAMLGAGAMGAGGVGGILATAANLDPTLAYHQPRKTAQQIREEAYMAAALAQEQAGLSGLSNTPYRPGGGAQHLPQRRFTRPGSR